MFSGKHNVSDKDKIVDIDRNQEAFSLLLNYIEYDEEYIDTLTSDKRHMLWDEAKYWDIPVPAKSKYPSFIE